MNKKAVFFNLFSVLTIITFSAIFPEQQKSKFKKFSEKFFKCITKQPKTEFEKFAEKFAPPANVRKTIESSSKWPHGLIDAKLKRNHSGWESSGFIKGKNGSPNIYDKGPMINRVMNAYILRRILNELQLDKFDVSEKYIHYHNNDWGVAAKAIKKDTSETAKHYSYEEVAQLIQLQKEICYWDFFNDNIFHNTENGKKTFIDTEDVSFAPRVFDLKTKQQCLERLHDFLSSDKSSIKIDNKSKQLLRDQIHKLSQSEDGTKPRDFLKEAYQKYNDTGIDFEKAEKEYWKIKYPKRT